MTILKIKIEKEKLAILELRKYPSNGEARIKLQRNLIVQQKVLDLITKN